MNRIEANTFYKDVLNQAALDNCVHRSLCHLARTDLFFLLTRVLHRLDANRDWLYDRCREVQANPNNYLDLWARYHYKSTIITFALTIQDILNNPDITICILSFNRPTAKAFLNQIKREFESNDLLKELFPSILWENTNTAPVWSLDNGIVVKRTDNPKEATIEAHGLVDSQPTGRHYNVLVYDDTVTRDSVTTVDMINKTTEAWELSRALTTEGGVSRYIGTRYHYNDTYNVMMERGSATTRIYQATIDNEPVLLPKVQLEEARRDMGSYTYAAQMMQDPKTDDTKGFSKDNIRYWYPTTEHVERVLNKIVLVDPANAKKKDSDYTSMMVLGMGEDNNYYVIDMVHDKLNLTERADKLFSLHRQYHPINVYYERYSMQADIQHIEYVQQQFNYRFNITEVGGKLSKTDRIDSLIPLFEANRIYIPRELYRTNYIGATIDVTKEFIDEYMAYPYSTHDDMLDTLARINDPVVVVNSTNTSHNRKKLKVRYK